MTEYHTTVSKLLRKAWPVLEKELQRRYKRRVKRSDLTELLIDRNGGLSWVVRK